MIMLILLLSVTFKCSCWCSTGHHSGVLQDITLGSVWMLMTAVNSDLWAGRDHYSDFLIKTRAC